MRQAVLTVYQSTAPGVYEQSGKAILFRQPYHDYGLAFTFNFERSYFRFQSDCDIQIYGINNEITSLFSFDPATYERRPKIEIRAGNSDFQLTDLNEIEDLKSSLPLIYSGLVYYFSDDRFATERVLTINLTDIDFSVQTKRIQGAFFRAGSNILSSLQTMLDDMENLNADFSLLEQSDFASETFPRDIEFSGQFLISGVLPKLSRQFGFSFHVDETGTLVFTGPGQGAQRDPIIVNSENGLVGYPQGINFNQYEVKTFFGKPDVFFPRDWMQIESPTLDAYTLVLSGKYSWNDTSAEITYIVSPDGEPVEKTPVLKF